MSRSEKMEAMSQAFRKLVTRYALRAGPCKGNEVTAWTGEYEGAKIRLSQYSDWFGVKVAFGDVYHANVANGYNVATQGIFEASAHYRTHEEATDPNRAGQAIPGNDIEGLCYRIGAVGPAGRQKVQSVEDRYVKSEDVVELALSYRKEIQESDADVDPFSKLQKFEEGWL